MYTLKYSITTQKMNVRTMYTVNGFQKNISTLPSSSHQDQCLGSPTTCLNPVFSSQPFWSSGVVQVVVSSKKLNSNDDIHSTTRLISTSPKPYSALTRPPRAIHTFAPPGFQRHYLNGSSTTQSSLQIANPTSSVVSGLGKHHQAPSSSSLNFFPSLSTVFTLSYFSFKYKRNRSKQQQQPYDNVHSVRE